MTKPIEKKKFLNLDFELHPSIKINKTQNANNIKKQKQSKNQYFFFSDSCSFESI